MIGHVQAHDPNTGRYVLIRVHDGEIVDDRARPFEGVEEIEPLERKRSQQPASSDPLGMYR